MSEVLALSGITKAYRSGAQSLPVLRGVDLTLKAGEIAALVAPSGAGKSTLLHIAGLLDTPDAGTIRLAGVDMSGQPDPVRTAARRNQIGFVYQFHHLLPEFSAVENIALPQRAMGRSDADAKAHAAQLLESVGLAHRADHRPAALSGGEQQRVAFCRALANRPALLLADEPTGNLDPETADIVFRSLLKLVRETGLAAIIATHNLDLAAQMDRALTLSAGRLTAT